MKAISSEVMVKYADKRRYFETELMKLKIAESMELQQRKKSMRESVIELDKDLKMLEGKKHKLSEILVARHTDIEKQQVTVQLLTKDHEKAVTYVSLMDTVGCGTGKSTFGKVSSMKHEAIRMLICNGFCNSAKLQGYSEINEWI